MKRNIYILVLIALSNFTLAQNKQFVIGKIVDSISQLPIEKASIKINHSNNGARSNIYGNFSIAINKTPLSITISHISYYPKTITIKSLKDTLKIELFAKTNDLTEISILSNKVVNLTKDKPIFIWDFTFQSNDILLLAYKNKNIFHPSLFVLKNNGDTINSMELFQPKKLYTDGLNNNHLITKKMAYQIAYDSSNVNFIYPTSLNEFTNAMNPFVTVNKNKYFFKQYFSNEQVLVYYSYDKTKDSLMEFAVIENAKGKRMLRDKARMMRMQGYTEADERFENDFMYKPVFAPLFAINDSIYLFDHEESVIKIYDENNSLKKEIPISYQNDDDWQKEFTMDKSTNKVYAIFKKDGLTSLAEINLRDGSIGPKVQIPEFVYIENIQINDGFVYFLYKEKINYEFKQLYKMPINS